jgi:putative transcriptional regulator
VESRAAPTRARWARLACAAVAATATPSATLDAAEAKGLKAGVFLYAAPGVQAGSFTESVVLLVQHGAEGSMGLIVNRPTRTPVREALDGLASLDLALYFGGPVQRDAAFALVRSPTPPPEAIRVLPDVYFSADLDQLGRVARAPDAASRLRVYAGYAGWAPGQLAGELRRELWVIGPADARSVFSSDADALWPRVYELLRRIEVRRRTPDPGLEDPADGGDSRAAPAAVVRAQDSGTRGREGAAPRRGGRGSARRPAP